MIDTGERMARRIWAAGACLAGLAVAAGAFGAHALRDALSPEHLAVWETAARYQMYHALALLAVSLAASRMAGPWRLAAALLVAGTVIFSGSLYALALTGIGLLGAVTPIGGLCWLAAWGILAVGVIRGRASPGQDAS